MGVQQQIVPINNHIFYNSEFKYPSIDYTNKQYRKALVKILNYYASSIGQLYKFLGRRLKEWDELKEYYRDML